MGDKLRYRDYDFLTWRTGTVTATDPFFGFQSFGDSNIDFFISITCTSRVGSFIVGSELIKRIHKRFGEEGIEINYPVRKLVSSENNVTRDNEILDQVMTKNQESMFQTMAPRTAQNPA